MKKITDFIKINYKALIVGFIVGLIVVGTTAYAAILYQSSEVGYDNTISGLSSQNVQDALDELHQQPSCPTPIDFATASWDEIVNAQPSQLQSSMKSGITKIVDLGSLGVHPVRIANLSTPSECSGSGFSQTACGLVIEFADIISTQKVNSTATSAGGWPATELRTYVSSTIYNALPSDLKSKIINTTVVSGYGTRDSSNFTSTDKLYLLSSHEVWEDVDGNINDGINYYDKAYSNTRQLDYYSLKSVTTDSFSEAIKKYNGSAAAYWLRSARSSTYYSFLSVTNTGNWGTGNANYSNGAGVSPVFRIA